jgi:hypothetical protein
MLRDLQQLTDAPAYGVTAIQGLLTAESMLQESLRFVPYCDEHRTVWSAHFTRVILDAASQVDSVWKATAGSSDKLTLKNHYATFGTLVAKQRVVFFGADKPITIAPFQVWGQGGFASPLWWDAYNKLKHDRFANQTEATLDHAVNAVGALLLAILYSGSCDLALISAGLLDPSSSNPWAFTPTGLLRDITFDCWAKIETQLFAHPLGVFGAGDCNLSPHWPSRSTRFNIWWALNAKHFTRPRTSVS